MEELERTGLTRQAPREECCQDRASNDRGQASHTVPADSDKSSDAKEKRAGSTYGTVRRKSRVWIW